MVRTQTVAAAAGWVWVALAAGVGVAGAGEKSAAPGEKSSTADRFGALLGTYTFESGESATPENPAAGVAFAPLSRAGVVGDGTGGGAFAAKGWESKTSTDARGRYVEFTVRAAPGYRVTVSAIAFNHRAAGGVPAVGEVSYSTDGFATAPAGGSVFAVSAGEGGTVSEWDCPDVGVSGENAVTFRFYAAGGAPVVLTLDDISVFGSVEKGETLGGAGGLPFETTLGGADGTARASDGGGVTPVRAGAGADQATLSPIGGSGRSPSSNGSSSGLTQTEPGGGTSVPGELPTTPTDTGSPVPDGVPPPITIAPEPKEPPPPEKPLVPPEISPPPPTPPTPPVPPVPPELVPKTGPDLPRPEPEPTPPPLMSAVTQLPEASLALGMLAPVFALSARRRRAG